MSYGDYNYGSRRSGINGGGIAVGVGTVALILIVIGMATCNFAMGVSGEIASHADQQARAWVSNMYPGETSHVSCQNQDTDSNGYVSCTVRIGERPPMGIECSVPLSLNNGCRIPPLQNMLQRQSQ